MAKDDVEITRDEAAEMNEDALTARWKDLQRRRSRLIDMLKKLGSGDGKSVEEIQTEEITINARLSAIEAALEIVQDALDIRQGRLSTFHARPSNRPVDIEELMGRFAFLRPTEEELRQRKAEAQAAREARMEEARLREAESRPMARFRRWCEEWLWPSLTWPFRFVWYALVDKDMFLSDDLYFRGKPGARDRPGSR